MIGTGLTISILIRHSLAPCASRKLPTSRISTFLRFSHIHKLYYFLKWFLSTFTMAIEWNFFLFTARRCSIFLKILFLVFSWFAVVLIQLLSFFFGVMIMLSRVMILIIKGNSLIIFTCSARIQKYFHFASRNRRRTSRGNFILHRIFFLILKITIFACFQLRSSSSFFSSWSSFS